LSSILDEISKDETDPEKVDTSKKAFYQSTVYAVSLIGVIGALYTIKTFGRRKLLLIGHSTILCLLIGLSICNFAKLNFLAYILVCLEIAVYNLTTLQAAWIFSAEVCVDSALGIVIMSLYIDILISGTLFPILNSLITRGGTFLFYAVITLGGIVYIYFYMPETKYLSDKEKKEVFWPGTEYGRPLKDGEVCRAGKEHKSRRTVRLEQGEGEDVGLFGNRPMSLNVDDDDGPV